MALAEVWPQSGGQTAPLTVSSQKNDVSAAVAAGSSNVEAPAVMAELDTPPAAQAFLSSSGTSPQDAAIDEMIVDLRYDRMILSPAIMGFGNESKIFLPLVQISRILDLNISSDRQTNRISGWFLDEDRRLEFDPATGTGTVDGKAVSLDSDQFKAKNDGVYVDSRVLSDWFPIDFSYDFSGQSILIDPRETLPFQERLKREALMNQVRQTRSNAPTLPLKEPEYQFIDPMFVDFGLSTRYRETNDANQGGEGQFYLLGRGDLAFMNAELYLTGDEDDRLNNFRLSLMREDPRGTMLGPLHATKVAAGDIRVPNFPVVGAAGYERGVSVNNQPLNSTGEYDTTYFIGSLSPGWDAQLFRNGVLLDSQQVGADGRYSFEDVPLYYGANEFTFKFYGPQGQEKEKTEQVMVGTSMMKPGHVQYQVAVTQKDEEIYDPLNQSDTLDQGSDRFIGRLKYGVNKNMSVQSGLESQTIDGKRHDYINAGVQGTIGQTFISTDAIKDLAGGTALELFGQRKAGPVDLKLKQQFFNDFIRDGETEASNTTQSKTDLSLSGILKGNNTLPDMPYSMSLNQTQKETSQSYRATARLAARLKDTHMSHSLTWQDDNSLSTDSRTLGGSSSLTSNIGKLRIRGTTNYDLYPDPAISKSDISGLYSLGRELSSELSLSHDVENNDLLTGTLGLNWNNGDLILSPSLSYNSDDNLTAFLSFSTSFGMDARSGKAKFTSAREASQGALSARVFHDNNDNQLFDEGDTPISGANVQADQLHKSAQTDEKGIAFLTGLRKNQQTDITLEKGSLEDPFWEPSKPGNSIITRPGHVEVVDIPVITTGEIDGTLYLEQPGKEKTSLNHVPIQLLDDQGTLVQELKSEYDGFYLFMKVPPGEYTVQLAPAFEQTLGVDKTAPVPVTIDRDGTVISGHDLVFSPRTSPLETRTAASTRVEQQTNNTPTLRWEGDGGTPEDPTSATQPQPSPAQAHPALPRTPVRKTAPEGQVHYGLHLASYRSLDTAIKGIDYQRDKHANLKDTPFTIKKTDLGAKGIWYRVFAGTSPDINQIKASEAGLDEKTKYSAPMPMETATGKTVHTASYRTMEKAEAHLKALVQKLGPDAPDQVSVRPVDLGKKGRWYRVLVGGYDQPGQAVELASLLKAQGNYARVMPLAQP